MELIKFHRLHQEQVDIEDLECQTITHWDKRASNACYRLGKANVLSNLIHEVDEGLVLDRGQGNVSQGMLER